MSNHTRKGYRPIQARDPKTGRLFTATVPIGGRLDKSIKRRLRKSERQQARGHRAFNEEMRKFKKTCPPELRAKVNWTDLRLRILKDSNVTAGMPLGGTEEKS